MILRDLIGKYVPPIAVFAGGMVGVGFLSLPYVALKSGIWILLAYFAVLTPLVLYINLIFVDISLQTPDRKRFPGFVKYHLGKWFGFFSAVSAVVGSIGVLLAYIIVGGEFLGIIFSGNIFIFSFLFFLAGSAIIFKGIKILGKVEFWILSLLVFSILMVFIDGGKNFSLINLQASGFRLQAENLFLPYGAIIFSIWGAGLVPEIEEMMSGNKKNLKKAVAIATILTSFLFFVFAFFVLGISGGRTGDNALSTLRFFVSAPVYTLALFSGVLVAFVAFTMQGTLLKESLVYDMGVKEKHAFIWVCFFPFLLFLLGFRSFMPVISFVGGVLLGINGILALMMYRKISGRTIVVILLSMVFLAGIIYELAYFFK